MLEKTSETDTGASAPDAAPSSARQIPYIMLLSPKRSLALPQMWR